MLIPASLGQNDNAFLHFFWQNLTHFTQQVHFLISNTRFCFFPLLNSMRSTQNELLLTWPGYGLRTPNSRTGPTIPAGAREGSRWFRTHFRAVAFSVMDWT